MNASCAVGASALRACSACAGDYEDPERTASLDESVDFDEEHEGPDAGQVRGDGTFPVEGE